MWSVVEQEMFESLTRIFEALMRNLGSSKRPMISFLLPVPETQMGIRLPVIEPKI